MKIRSGFVSNSSSSSFIVGIGLIRPGQESEVAKIFDESEIHSVVETVCDDKRSKYAEPQIENGGNVLSYSSFNGQYIDINSIYDDMKKLGVDDLKFVFFDSMGDEPEYDDDEGSYNYDGFDDVDSGHFDDHDIKKYKALNNNSELFLQGDAICGAGYNG